MASKSRPRVYPRPEDLHELQLTRGEVARERRLSAMADTWAATQGVDLERLVGGIVTQAPKVIGWQRGMPKALTSIDLAAIREQGGSTVTTNAGRTFAADDAPYIGAASIDSVRQAKRLQASPSASTRVIHRPACVRPCLTAARNPRHRCVDEHRTYVRRLAPDKAGRARWRTVGYWTDGDAAGSLAIGAYAARAATWTDWPHESHLTGPSACVAGTYDRTDRVGAWVWHDVARECEYIDVERGTRSMWVAAKVKRESIGRPRKVATAELSARSLARRIAESVEGQRWVALILEAADLTYRATEPTAVAVGSHGARVTYDPRAEAEHRLTIADSEGRPLASSSWKGRRMAAREAALALIDD